MREKVADIPPFNQVLKDTRRKYGLSQEDLAVALGISRFSVSRLERGLTNPPKRPDFYSKIAEIPGWDKEDVKTLVRSGASYMWEKYGPKVLAQAETEYDLISENRTSL